MWRDWDADAIRADLGQMRELGVNVFRSFLLWPDFMPSPGAVDTTMMERLGEFLGLCKEAELQTALTLFVGHMSGENWDVPWRGGRDFYADPWMLEQERAYVEQIVGAFASHAAMFGWILSNELPVYAGIPEQAALRHWVRTMTAAIRSLDAAHPIGLGDGTLEGLGARTGFQSPEVLSFVDFVGCHVYPRETDTLRHAYAPSAMIRALDGDKPVILEEFGCSNAWASEDNQAGTIRATLHGALAAGAAGAWPWCFGDFNLPASRPYAQHPAELLFGLTRADGTPKPAASALAEFAELAKQVDFARFRVPKPIARLIVPASRSQAVSFPPDSRAEAASRTLLQSYVTARQAGLCTGFIYEPPVDTAPHAPVTVDYRWPMPEDVSLLLLPALPPLTAPAWGTLEEWVRDGGTLYCSYHPQWAVHNFEALFGCRHELRCGLPAIPPEQLELTFKRPFGPIAAGETLRCKTVGSIEESGMCPVHPTSAEVLAHDADGRPALLINRLDAGKVVLAAYPLEAYLSRMPEAYRNDATYRLYQGLMAAAGIQPLFLFSHPCVECAWLEGEGEYLVWLINHSWEKVEGTLITPSAAPTIQDVAADQLVTTRFAMGAKQVRVLKVVA
jgi:endo-1,4-beta-mannosidase